MRTLPIALFAAGLLGLTAGQGMAAVSATDRTFAENAAAGGVAEVQEAQLAQQQAASPQVKQFANRIMADHTQANNELMQIAEQSNLQLPAEPKPQQSAMSSKLRNLKGAAFDQSYIQHQVQDHQTTIQLFEREAKSGQDPALKEFAQKTLPILRQHLQMAQQLASAQR